MSIIIFLVILLILVLVHECGHFFAAKKFDIRVDEFGFGFPPKLFGYKYGETEYTLNLLPLGGFVKIFGENPEKIKVKPNMLGFTSNTTDTNGDMGRSFGNKPKWQQAVVLSGGIAANFLLAWVLFSISFISGLPMSVSNSTREYPLQNVNLIVTSVLPNSPAEKGGLKPGDRIVAVNSGGDSIAEIDPASLKNFIVLHPGQDILISYERGTDGAFFTPGTLVVVPTVSGEGEKAAIGIAMDQVGVAKLPFLQALSEGMMLTLSVTQETALGLYGLVRDALVGQGSLESVTGPVGLVGIVGEAYHFGFTYLLSFMALISINLAIINAIPFPALDGGRLFFLLIEKIKGSPMNAKFFNIANTAGFAVLILLMILVTYNDITNLF